MLIEFVETVELIVGAEELFDRDRNPPTEFAIGWLARTIPIVAPRYPTPELWIAPGSPRYKNSICPSASYNFTWKEITGAGAPLPHLTFKYWRVKTRLPAVPVVW
ncbi:hypothetical protein D3C78_1326750 [compost metagenome]